MTYPKAIVISAALIAAAIAFAAYQPAQSAFGGHGRYMLVADSTSAWVFNIETAELRFCLSPLVSETECNVVQKKW